METKKIMFTAAVIFALLITIGSALAVAPELEITDMKVGKTGETLVSYDDGNETAAFQPGDEITVKMKVKNNGLVTIEDLVITAHVDAELTNFPSTPAPSHLNANQEKEVTYTYKIPANLDTVDGLETYLVEFHLEGEDEANNYFDDTRSFLLKIEQKQNNVFVDNLKLYVANVEKTGQLTCQEKQLNAQVKVKLVNNGLEDPTNVKVTLTNPALAIDMLQTVAISAESTNPGNQFVTFPINAATITGQHQLTVKVYRSAQFPDKIYDTETLTVSGEDCVVSITAASPQSPVVVDKLETKEFNVEVNNPQILVLTYGWKVDGVVQQNEVTNTFVLNPAPAALNLSLGQHTVTVTISGSDPSLPISKEWNVEIADNPAAFTISGIVFTDAEQGTTVTKQVTVKNVGSSEALTEIVASFVGVDSDYAGKITIDPTDTLKTTLNAGEQDTLTLKINVPADADDGIVGKLHVEGKNGNDEVVFKEANIDLNFKSYLKVSSVKVNGKTNGDLSLSESNEIKVEVRNDYTEDLDNVVVTVALLDADGDEVEKVEKDLFEDSGDSLGNGDEESVTLELDLQNEDLDENEYTLEITVEGEEGNNDYTTVKTLTVQVDRGDEEATITKAELSNSKLQCSAKTTLYVTIKNNSDKELNNLKLRVRNDDLNLDLSKSNIDLEDYSGNDNEYETTFELELADAAADAYTLTVELLDDNDVIASENVELEVKECLSESTSDGSKEYYADEKLKDELQKSLAEYRKAQDQPVVKASFRESEEYTLLLGVLVILMALASVLSMVVLLTKRR